MTRSFSPGSSKLNSPLPILQTKGDKNHYKRAIYQCNIYHFGTVALLTFTFLLFVQSEQKYI